MSGCNEDPSGKPTPKAPLAAAIDAVSPMRYRVSTIAPACVPVCQDRPCPYPIRRCGKGTGNLLGKTDRRHFCLLPVCPSAKIARVLAPSEDVARELGNLLGETDRRHRILCFFEWGNSPPLPKTKNLCGYPNRISCWSLRSGPCVSSLPELGFHVFP